MGVSHVSAAFPDTLAGHGLETPNSKKSESEALHVPSISHTEGSAYSPCPCEAALPQLPRCESAPHTCFHDSRCLPSVSECPACGVGGDGSGAISSVPDLRALHLSSHLIPCEDSGTAPTLQTKKLRHREGDVCQPLSVWALLPLQGAESGSASTSPLRVGGRCAALHTGLAHTTRGRKWPHPAVLQKCRQAGKGQGLGFVGQVFGQH